MLFLEKLKKIFKRGVRFIEVPKIFISKDDLFTMTFDDNWLYHSTGNSFYFFGNEKDDLKGSLQFSIIWNRPVIGHINSLADLEKSIREEENVEISRVIISNNEALYLQSNYKESNLDFHQWYIYTGQIYIQINFMIFENETIETKLNWLNRITKILHTLNFDEAKIFLRSIQRYL